jgi:hypothetical protein
MRRNILLLPLALAVVAGCRDQELPTESAPAAASHAVSVGDRCGHAAGRHLELRQRHQQPRADRRVRRQRGRRGAHARLIFRSTATRPSADAARDGVQI